jgi:hypothetical protein
MEPDSSLTRAVNRHVSEGNRPLIVLQEGQAALPIAVLHEALGVPPDLFSLFSLVQKHLEKHPRRNLRLAIQLPGMLCTGASCHLAEVLSLSTNGLFVKTGFRPAKDALLRVVIPLMGMQQELELDGRILYRVEPGPGNNYFQGIGIEFAELSKEARLALQAFLEHRFIDDLATRPGGEKLRLASTKVKEGEITLRLDPA